MYTLFAHAVWPAVFMDAISLENLLFAYLLYFSDDLLHLHHFMTILLPSIWMYVRDIFFPYHKCYFWSKFDNIVPTYIWSILDLWKYMHRNISTASKTMFFLIYICLTTHLKRCSFSNLVKHRKKDLNKTIRFDMSDFMYAAYSPGCIIFR